MSVSLVAWQFARPVVLLGVLLVIPALASGRATAQCQYEVTIIQEEDCRPFGVPPVIPQGINEAGHIVGYLNPCVVGLNFPFVWTPESGIVPLDMPPGTNRGRALDINDAGEIVGWFDLTGDEFGDLAFSTTASRSFSWAYFRATSQV